MNNPYSKPQSMPELFGIGPKPIYENNISKENLEVA
jgi:hypothetical protein